MIDMNLLTLPIEYQALHYSLFSFVNLISAALVSVSGAALLFRNWSNFYSPALIIVGLLNILFQWPLFVWSGVFEVYLPSHWVFAISLHMLLLLMLVWIVLCQRVEGLSLSGGVKRYHKSIISDKTLYLLLLTSLLLLGGYLVNVHFDCTALYAMFVDPEMGLLAREMSIKLAGSKVATYSYGALANVFCPAIFFIFILKGWKALLGKDWKFVLYFLIAAEAFFVVLLPGIKGMLLPTLVVLVTGGLTLGDGLIKKAMLAAVFLFVSAFLLVSFEVFRESGIIESEQYYNVGRCAVENEVCDQTLDLVQSLKYREEGSLGIAPSRIYSTYRDVWRQCTGEGQFAIGHKYDGDKTVIEIEDVVARSEDYLDAIIRRAFIVPLQVAGWHYLYVDEHGAPGKEALPLAKKIFGESVDMTSVVYQTYGIIYSSGDKTATATAPTSFVFTYPAYFGFWGFVGVALILICFDLFWRLVLGRASGLHLALSGGLMMMGCINFMLSDFLTVMISHGGALSFILAACLVFLGGKNDQKVV